jgi:molybdopterin-guanine dinucleotide biosynthesis protein A
VSFQAPIGAIYYGLKAATSEICFVTSCDAPVLDLRSIRSLLAALGDADVAVPFLAELFAALARGIPQIGHGFAGAATRRAQIAAGTFI